MSRSLVFSPCLRPSAAAPSTTASALGALILLALGLTAGCGTNNSYYETQNVYPAQGEGGKPGTPPGGAKPDAGAPNEPTANGDAGVDAGAPDAGAEPDDGLPRVDTAPEALAVDVLRGVGNRYYFVVNDEQLERMNERYLGGGFPGPIFGFGDIYTPGGGNGGDATFVDRLLVSTPGESANTADFGKVQVKLVGESTGRPWTTESLPNFKIDADEFTKGNRIGGVKHFRLNNAIVGSIFREKLTLDLYEKLGYPAPRASYAWVQSSVWGPEVDVPYIVVESYKPAFCKEREAAIGGGCVNMWEFPGDLGNGQLGYAESCQFSECDATRALDFEQAAVDTPLGPGFKEALGEWLDWDAFHRFQCLSWILATGDDVLHNSNNFVMMERTDGKFQHLPYSIDISLGQEWYPEVSLAGGSLLARGCQSDPQCWDDTITSCEGVLDAFIAANPIAMLDANYALLSQQGMLRDGDEARYESIASYLARRIVELPVELELNREGPPPTDFCDFPFVLCGDVCMFPEECLVCEPEPEPADAGVESRGVAADVALPVPGEPGVDPGEPPQACMPFVEDYDPGVVPRPR
jgi:hypothetical protein